MLGCWGGVLNNGMSGAVKLLYGVFLNKLSRSMIKVETRKSILENGLIVVSCQMAGYSDNSICLYPIELMIDTIKRNNASIKRRKLIAVKTNAK